MSPSEMMEIIADMQAAVKLTGVAKPRCCLAGAIEVRARQFVEWSLRALLPLRHFLSRTVLYISWTWGHCSPSLTTRLS